jgi:hypothetical protein
MSESALIPHRTKALNTISARPIVPAIVAAAGDGAARRFLEFFTPKGGAHRRLAEVIMRTARYGFRQRRVDVEFLWPKS